jgi:hypothetical protein
MAGTPNQISSGFNSIKSPSTTHNSTNQPAPEFTFKRSPSPEPQTLPATTFSGLPSPKQPELTLKRSLSLESPKPPGITITSDTSPERPSYGFFKHPTTPDMGKRVADIVTQHTATQSGPE